MSDLKDGEPENRIINEPMSEALSKRYLAYALSTITARALPDVRDGLKPVQRRILYGMRVLRLDPEGGYRKCAKIVGDVMGNFHPHGDSSIYDTLVRLAQDFTVRYPLVDGRGELRQHRWRQRSRLSLHRSPDDRGGRAAAGRSQ